MKCHRRRVKSSFNRIGRLRKGRINPRLSISDLRYLSRTKRIPSSSNKVYKKELERKLEIRRTQKKQYRKRQKRKSSSSSYGSVWG